MLLAIAVGFLAFLIVFQQALFQGLVDQFVGAIRHQSAEVLVYSSDARKNLQGGVVSAETVTEVAAVPGVEQAGPLGVGAATVRADGRDVDVTLFGYQLGGPGEPTSLIRGRVPQRDGEAVASSGGGSGLGLGDTVTVVPGALPVVIVGVARNARFSVQPTLFTSFATYQQAREAANPDAAAIPPSAAAVTAKPGVDPARLARTIERSVPDVEALERGRAAAEAPGVGAVNQSLAVVLLLTYLSATLVVGFFFLILTVQKARSLTMLRALGTAKRPLVGALLAQVLAVVVGGVVAGVALAWLLLAIGVGTIDATLQPRDVAITAAVLVVLSLVAATGAVRRVLRIDPYEATLPAHV